MTTELSDTFIDSVKDALENLYDYTALQRHHLVQHFAEEGGQGLRRQLLDAIERLNPGTDVYFRSPHARLYNLLQLHYVEGLTIQETATELSISARQAYRDLRKGQESVAEILQAELQKTDIEHHHHDTPNTNVIELPEVPIEMFDLTHALQLASQSVQRLANAQDKTLVIELPQEQINISTMRPIAQQILINTLSYAIQNSKQDVLKVVLEQNDEGAVVMIHYQADNDYISPSIVIEQLIDKLGWSLKSEFDNGNITIHIAIRTEQTRIMVIDDNEGIIELMDRYLSADNRRIISATNPLDAIDMLQHLTPNVIILDVMMPDMDGWEVLQRLRLIPHISNVPIVICSVFNDPELAYSLGADALIPKPIGQYNVLTTLKTIGVL